MTISYDIGKHVSAEQAADLFKRAGLNRPKDRSVLERMIENASLLITAWDGEKLVGFLRAFTDFCFDCYLNDIAVDKDYQQQHIGRELMQQLYAALDTGTMVFLIAAPDAVGFYRRLGFKNFDRLEDTWYTVVGRK